MVINIRKLALLGYGIYLSAVIGIIAAIYLIVEGALSSLVWSSNNRLLETGLVILGSGLLYFSLKRWPNLPKNSKDSMTELKQNQTIDYNDVFLNLLITLVILSFGAGVGPEAALLSAIISLSIWEADNLRYLYFHFDELKKLSTAEIFKRLLNPLAYRQKYDEEKSPDGKVIHMWKTMMYSIFGINGVIAFWMLINQTDQPSFILKLGKSNWQLTDLKVLPLLIIGGIIFGFFCKYLYHQFTNLIDKLNLPLLGKVTLGAIGILLIVYLAPDLLFSGQHSMHLLIGDWSQKSPSFLILMAVLKLVFLAWCLNLHWRGGDIFPITFASATLGFAVAGLLPNFDTLFVVAVVATTVMSELSSPIVGGVFILLFFPLKLSPIIIFVAAVMFAKNKLVAKYKNQQIA